MGRVWRREGRGRGGGGGGGQKPQLAESEADEGEMGGGRRGKGGGSRQKHQLRTLAHLYKTAVSSTLFRTSAAATEV